MHITRSVRTIVLAILVVAPSLAHGQQGDTGFMWTLSAGTGYSSHAASYQEPLEFGGDKEFSGYRIFILETRVGWTFTETTAAYLTGNVSPGNSTISPYKSFYAGVGASQGFRSLLNFYIKGGAGYYRSGVGEGQTAGDGVLVNAGLGMYFSPRFHAEFNTYFGKMNPDPTMDPNPFQSNELQFQLNVAFDIL